MDSLSISDAAAILPGALALTGDVGEVRFDELAERAMRIAAALEASHPDERCVAFEAVPDLDTLALVYGLLARHRCFLPLHPRWSESERRETAARLGASFVSREELEALASPAVWEGSRSPRAVARRSMGNGADEVACWLTTSGSSGAPRGVALARSNLLASARGHDENVPFIPGDRWLLGLTFAHAGGLSILTRCLRARSTVVVLARYDPRRTIDAIARQRVTLLSVVPSMLEQLLDADDGTLRSLRAVLVGGAALSPELRRRSREAGVPVIASYGMTETASQVAAQRPHEAGEEGDDSGRPLGKTEVTVLDAAGDPVAPGTVGRIHVRGPTVMVGYVGETPRDSDRPFDTRDLGWLDDRGRLHVVGRADDTIVTGGENVHPSEVERVLRALPEVLDTAVLGVPDARWGQIVAAAVVLRRGASLGSVIAAVPDILPSMRRPRRWAVVDGLPRNAMGKLDRGALLAEWSRESG